MTLKLYTAIVRPGPKIHASRQHSAKLSTTPFHPLPPDSMLSLMRNAHPRAIQTTTSTLHEGSRGAACTFRVSGPRVLKFCSRWFAFMLFPGTAALSYLPQTPALPCDTILMKVLQFCFPPTVPKPVVMSSGERIACASHARHGAGLARHVSGFASGLHGLRLRRAWKYFPSQGRFLAGAQQACTSHAVLRNSPTTLPSTCWLLPRSLVHSAVFQFCSTAEGTRQLCPAHGALVKRKAPRA